MWRRHSCLPRPGPPGRLASILVATLLVGSAAGLPGQDRQSTPSPKRPVLVTTDCGAAMDDQWALAHLLLSPELEVRGVVTTHTGSHRLLAEPAAENSARNALEVLDRLPLRSRPPVLAGSSRPLRDKTAPLANAGVDFILREARGFSTRSRLTVLVIGAATDLASAILTDPTLAERIEIVAMGFARWPAGTDTFNVKNDVSAWQVLMESRAPIVIGDSAVTTGLLRMRREGARRLFYSRGPAGRYLAGLLTTWLDRNADLAKKVSGDRDSCPIWDQVVVAYLLGMTKSVEYRRPRLRDDLSFDHGQREDQVEFKITWITWIDSGRLWGDFTAKLDRALEDRTP